MTVKRKRTIRKRRKTKRRIRGRRKSRTRTRKRKSRTRTRKRKSRTRTRKRKSRTRTRKRKSRTRTRKRKSRRKQRSRTLKRRRRGRVTKKRVRRQRGGVKKSEWKHIPINQIKLYDRYNDKVYTLRQNYKDQILNWQNGKYFDKDWLRGTSGNNPYFLTQNGDELYLITTNWKKIDPDNVILYNSTTNEYYDSMNRLQRLEFKKWQMDKSYDDSWLNDFHTSNPYFLTREGEIIYLIDNTQNKTNYSKSSSNKGPSISSNNPAELIYSIYTKGYEPPKWALTKYKQNINDFGPRCQIYHDPGYDSDHILKLATEREPVNIGMKRLYDQDRLNRHFGWRIGYYVRYFEKQGGNRLASNIAIYCPTLVKIGNSFKKINVINSIGYAFDDDEQPDYHYFIKKRRQGELPNRYYRIFQKIFKCAQKNNFDTIVMSLVGAGNFAELYGDRGGRGVNYFRNKIWLPAFEKCLERWQNRININILWMGTDYENDIGHFPKNVNHRSVKNNLDKTLFVNAWDPLSMPGNGNRYDNSLDGFIGRSTQIALLCWPITNHYLQDKEQYISIE